MSGGDETSKLICFELLGNVFHLASHNVVFRTFNTIEATQAPANGFGTFDLPHNNVLLPFVGPLGCKFVLPVSLILLVQRAISATTVRHLHLC